MLYLLSAPHLSSYRWCRRRRWRWALHGNARPACSPAPPHPAAPAVQMSHQCCGSGSGGSVINWTPGFGSVITDPNLATNYLSKNSKNVKCSIINKGFTTHLTTYYFSSKNVYEDQDPAGSMINWPPRSGAVIQDYESADPNPNIIFSTDSQYCV